MRAQHIRGGRAGRIISGGEDGGKVTVSRFGALSGFCIPSVRTRSGGDPGQGRVHVGLDTTTAETVVSVTYLAVPVGQSPLVVAPPPGC